MKHDYGSVLALADAAVESWFRHMPRSALSAQERNSCQIVAHRGCWDHSIPIYENTLDAFQAALNCGVWGVEFDVQWTSDNIPVVIHDPHTARIPDCVGVEIGKCSFSELRKHCRSVPTLQELIERFGKRLHLMIELKSETISKVGLQNLTAQLAVLEPLEHYHLMALNVETLNFAAEFPIESRLLIATTDTAKKFEQTLKHDVGGLTGHYLLLNRRMRRQLAQRNIKWGTGFVNSVNLLAREIRSGTEWFFSNSADLLAKQIS